jgi:hypothetical protein
MGWKSQVQINRAVAREILIERILSMTISQLEDALTELGFGDTIGLPYYGKNFKITDEEDENT